MVASSGPAAKADAPGLLRAVVSFADATSRWSGHVIAPVSLVYMLIIVFEVVMRYVFNRPTNWAHELSTFLFGAQFMLGGAYCMWRGSMVNVEILHQRFPPRVRAAIDAVLLLVAVGICVLMIRFGSEHFMIAFARLERTNTTWGPPLYPVKLVIPAAGLLLLIQVIAQFLRRLYTALTGETMDTATAGVEKVEVLE